MIVAAEVGSMRRATLIELTEQERATLEGIARSGRSQVRAAERARMILLAASGHNNEEIAATVGAGVHSVGKWRRRFGEKRLDGLVELPGRGRKPDYDAERVKQIVDTTVRTTPEGETHWSTRTLARRQGVSHSTIRRIWNTHHLKPHLVRTFKLSNDKRFTEKLRDIVGLYLNPPEHALVLCVDEKTQIQALDRTQPGLPMKKGRCGTMTHDYKRNGTTTLFAALNMLDGKVIGSSSGSSTERRPRISTCTSSWTTTPRISTSACRAGSRSTQGSTSTSSQHRRPG